MLTPKKKIFIKEYLVDRNATQAAIRAGYSKRTAYSQGQRLLKDVEVAAEINKANEKANERNEITVDRIRQEMARVAFSNVENYLEWGPEGIRLKDSNELPEDALRAIAEVSESFGKEGNNIKFKLHNKMVALEQLAKHCGMYVERHEHEHAVAIAPYDEKKMGFIQRFLEGKAEKPDEE